MPFQSRARTLRDFGKRPTKSRQRPRPEKNRALSTRRLDEERPLGAKGIVDRTVNMLRHLGSQRFAVAPFHEHFDRWMLSLKDIIAEFESSGALDVDEQFRKESSDIVSQIERELNEHRLSETRHADKVRIIHHNLLEKKSLLAKAEREIAVRSKEMARQEESAMKPVATRIGRLKNELNQISRIRAGFLRSISKKAKAQRQEEAAQKLESTRNQLKQVERSFAVGQKKLKEEYDNKKRQLLKQIDEYDRELETLEAEPGIDDVVEIRQAACEKLVNAVNTLLERNPASPDESDAE